MGLIVKNSKGEEIKLNAVEQRIADYNQTIVNALGVEIDITTLTTIVKKVTEQKFFEVMPADYLPIRVGEGAWSTQLTTYRSFLLGDAFDTGVVNLGSNNSRLAGVAAGVDPVTVAVRNWAKEMTYSLFELQTAIKAGNWDLITTLEQSRKKNWDLGIQQVAFLGLKSDPSVKGLLTQSDVTVDTSTINEPIKGMTSTELNALCQALYEAYRLNSARTSKPTAFIIPESDFNGLASQVSDDFPIKTKLELLEQMFQAITMNKSFKVLPIAYADTAYSQGLLTYPRYTLLNQEETSIRMDIPVDYTSTVQNTINGFTFQNVGYGQFTGAKAYRPLEMLYFDNNG